MRHFQAEPNLRDSTPRESLARRKGAVEMPAASRASVPHSFLRMPFASAKIRRQPRVSASFQFFARVRGLSCANQVIRA